jgi:hypothetical protein
VEFCLIGAANARAIRRKTSGESNASDNFSDEVKGFRVEG